MLINSLIFEKCYKFKTCQVLIIFMYIHFELFRPIYQFYISIFEFNVRNEKAK